MSFYNWKTGRWVTYDQCRGTSIVAADQKLTLEKYSPEKIEEKALPQSRIERIFNGYMRFENRIYEWMLSKDYHRVAAPLAKHLLPITVACILMYAFFKLIVFAFQLFFMLIAFMLYEREMTVLDNIFWCGVLFCIGYILVICFGPRIPDSPPSQNNETQPKQKNKPLKIELRGRKTLFGGIVIEGVAEEQE